MPFGGQAPQGPEFRDRAKERREQKGEYETIAQEFESHAEVSLEQSKYLGGDLEHTHLVKGLDYALLSKVRTEMTKQKKAEELASLRAQRKASGQKKRAFESQLGRRVWHSTVETLHPHHSTFRKRVEGMSKAIAMGQRIRGAPSIFLPGRMAYEFDIGIDLSKSSSDIPRTVYTSKEDAPTVDSSKRVASILPETVHLIRHTLQKVAVERRQRRRDRIAGGTNESSYAVAQKIVPKHKAKDVDEDIFAGVGSFDVTAAAKMAKSRTTVTTSMHKKTSTAKSSYFADAGTAKYLRGPEGQLELSEIAVDEREVASTVVAPGANDDTCEFEAAERFLGPRRGWAFKLGKQGLGYYREDWTLVSSAQASGASLATKKRKRSVAAPAPDDDDAYGECFPDSGLGHAGVGTGDGESDEDGDDTKGKIERLKKLAGKGGSQVPDSVAANQKKEVKKKFTETQQWQKIDHMIKKGKTSSLEELEARSSRPGRKQPLAPREITSTPAYF
mmetsp:Transcript_145638/g.369557  ORF Transcript_145638/g.369557 Transcript_145638/m.369557 type:complete len:502 (-) Transcript_145638:341-1846(-)